MQKAKATVRGAPILEVIACSVSDAIEAQRGGAGRLEIIRDFQRGGLTPSLELVQEILDAVTLPVRVMVREGDCYEVAGEVEREKLGAAARRLSETWMAWSWDFCAKERLTFGSPSGFCLARRI